MNFDSLIARLKGTAGVRESVATYIRERAAERKAAVAQAKAAGATDAQIAPLLAVDAEDEAHVDQIAAAIVESP